VEGYIYRASTEDQPRTIDHATARTKKVGRADAISLCPSKNALKGRERLMRKEGVRRKPGVPPFSAVGEAPNRKKNPNRAPSPTPTGVRPQHPERGGTEGGNSGGRRGCLSSACAPTSCHYVARVCPGILSPFRALRDSLGCR
jgi:hypothetical protein